MRISDWSSDVCSSDLDTNDVRQKLRAEYAPKFSAHGDAISLNADLFARIKTLYEQRDSLGLDAQGVRLVERYYTGFVRNGANLSEADKAHLKDINGQMAKLGTQFSENLLAEVNASDVVVDDKAELDGLNDEQITYAAAQAQERGLDGTYVITMPNTTGQPPLERKSVG